MSNLVNIKVEPCVEEAPWGDGIPMPAMVMRNKQYVAVVFSLEQAEQLFCRISDLYLMICVDPPRSLYVTNVAEAAEFFGMMTP